MYMLISIGVFMGKLSRQSILLNQFATDRAGLLGICLGLFLVAALVAPGGSALLWAAALISGLSSYIVMAPVAALPSALFPKPADLGKMGNSGNTHAAAALIGTLLTVVAAIPPTLVMGIGYQLLASPLPAFCLMLLWTLLACVLALPLLGEAARMLEARRENLAQVAHSS